MEDQGPICLKCLVAGTGICGDGGMGGFQKILKSLHK